MKQLATCLLLALVAGCSGGEANAPIERYLALGDSFTSGAGLAEPVADGGACQQSRLSYPHLVAAELEARLTDASCGGASTENATVPQPRPDDQDWAPQLSRLTRGTDLVTIGLGFNDLGFYSGLFFGCTSLAGTDPDGAPCRASNEGGGPNVASLPEQIGTRVEQLARTVRDTAPGAEVVVVGYPQLVPESGTCAELPLAEGDYPFVRETLAAFDDELRAGAERAGATYVDVMEASEGHDVCAGDDAWVSGATGSEEQRAPYHPLPQGQQAVADLVLDALGA